MPVTRNEKIFDESLELKDAGLVAASAAATVSSAAAYYDTQGAEVEGYLILEVTACEVATGDELYTIKLQGDAATTFDTDLKDLVTFPIGDAAVLVGTTDLGVARYVLPFTNVVAGTAERYLRVYTVVAGTIATGVNYQAWLSI